MCVVWGRGLGLRFWGLVFRVTLVWELGLHDSPQDPLLSPGAHPPLDYQ